VDRKMRRVSNHFRSGIETMIREAEELERKWREQNAEIMAANPAVPKRRLLRFPTRRGADRCCRCRPA
jgi:hypothetical protein